MNLTHTTSRKKMISLKITYRLVLFLVSIILLIGCATQPKLAETEFHLTRNDTAKLPLPGTHPDIEHQQLLTTTVRGHDISFYAIVTIKDNKLELMALTPVGIRIFKAIYDGSTVTTEQFIPDIPLPNMTEVIANIMLAYYPKDSWEMVLPLNITINDSLFDRKVHNAQQGTIITIEYEQINGLNHPTKIHNSALNYTINLKNIK